MDNLRNEKGQFIKGHSPWIKSGSNHHNWNGGRRVVRGYVEIQIPDHPNVNYKGYVRLSHLVVEQELGRYLLPGEVVHHDDKDKANNLYENLRLFENQSEHQKYERFLQNEERL